MQLFKNPKQFKLQTTTHLLGHKFSLLVGFFEIEFHRHHPQLKNSASKYVRSSRVSLHNLCLLPTNSAGSSRTHTHTRFCASSSAPSEAKISKAAPFRKDSEHQHLKWHNHHLGSLFFTLSLSLARVLPPRVLLAELSSSFSQKLLIHIPTGTCIHANQIKVGTLVAMLQGNKFLPAVLARKWRVVARDRACQENDISALLKAL